MCVVYIYRESMGKIGHLLSSTIAIDNHHHHHHQWMHRHHAALGPAHGIPEGKKKKNASCFISRLGVHSKLSITTISLIILAAGPEFGGS